MKAYTPMNWVRRKTWIGIILIAIGVLVSAISSCNSMRAVRKEKTKITTTTMVKTIVKQEGYEPKSPVVIATPDKVSNPIFIPFGKDGWIDTKGNVFCFKNGKPFLWNEKHLILKPGDTGIPFGDDCRSLAFQSAEPNNVIVVVHLRDHQH